MGGTTVHEPQGRCRPFSAGLRRSLSRSLLWPCPSLFPRSSRFPRLRECSQAQPPELGHDALPSPPSRGSLRSPLPVRPSGRAMGGLDLLRFKTFASAPSVYATTSPWQGAIVRIVRTLAPSWSAQLLLPAGRRLVPVPSTPTGAAAARGYLAISMPTREFVSDSLRNARSFAPHFGLCARARPKPFCGEPRLPSRGVVRPRTDRGNRGLLRDPLRAPAHPRVGGRGLDRRNAGRRHLARVPLVGPRPPPRASRGQVPHWEIRVPRARPDTSRGGPGTSGSGCAWPINRDTSLERGT
jgi:hypothetical protein